VQLNSLRDSNCDPATMQAFKSALQSENVWNTDEIGDKLVGLQRMGYDAETVSAIGVFLGVWE
jgi:hypothetical protein